MTSATLNVMRRRRRHGGVIAGALAAALLLAGCSIFTAPERGVDYPAPAATAVPERPAASPPSVRPRQSVGAGQDAEFERSAFLADTFYHQPDVLLDQVERSGAMGVNRGFEIAARKGGEWYIEEQRFADTIIGAGVNHNRRDLIDAGLRALEWGYARQAADGSFPCPDPYLGASYFVAATAHSLWLLEASGLAASYRERIDAMRPKLARAAHWIADGTHPAAVLAQQDVYSSRRFVTGYALAASGRDLGDTELVQVGDDMVARGLKRQQAAGYFLERGGFDSGFQAEGLVYLLRYYDHAASPEMQRRVEPALRRALAWLASRVTPRGVIRIVGNTRSGGNQERDRTGAPRRVSAVAVVRAFGLARYVFGDAKFETLARTVATARQAG